MNRIIKRAYIMMSALVMMNVAGYALDLSAFQGFLRPSNDTNTAKAKPITLQNTGIGPVYNSADAAYKDNRVVTLSNSGQGPQNSLSLPPATRVPEGLRPLLTDRKTPRQGVGLSGGTGAQLVPSPGVLEPGKSAIAVHVVPFDLKDINDKTLDDQDYMDTNIAVAFGTMEGVEIGIDKSFGNQDTYDVNEPLFINLKYQVPGNITVGGSFCSGSDAYNSVWVSAGVPVAWVGVGANFGPGDYHFSYRGHDEYYRSYSTFKRAKFGGYNYDYNTGKGYADPVFFLVGGAVPLGENAGFIYDFNGDRFSLGFRFNYQKTLFFDASYISDGDYERLPGAIAHKRMRNVTFGGAVAF